MSWSKTPPKELKTQNIVGKVIRILIKRDMLQKVERKGFVNMGKFNNKEWSTNISKLRPFTIEELEELETELLREIETIL